MTPLFTVGLIYQQDGKTALDIALERGLSKVAMYLHNMELKQIRAMVTKMAKIMLRDDA